MSETIVTRQQTVKTAEELCAAYNALIDQVVALAGVVEAVREDLVQPTGQSLARAQVLSAVAQHPAPVGTIAETLGHTRQSVQRIADLLVTDGLARYLPNPAHRRAKLVEVTPAGLTAVDDFTAAQDLCARRTAHDLDPNTLDTARQTLSDLRQRLQQQL